MARSHRRGNAHPDHSNPDCTLCDPLPTTRCRQERWDSSRGRDTTTAEPTGPCSHARCANMRGRSARCAGGGSWRRSGSTTASRSPLRRGASGMLTTMRPETDSSAATRTFTRPIGAMDLSSGASYYGTGLVEWRDVPAEELSNPTSFEGRFRG